jgi:Oxidoreductase family, NAD-binding Rossmann fold
VTPAETLRVGVLGTDNGHAHLYCAYINGWHASAPMPVSPKAGESSSVHRWMGLLRSHESLASNRLPIPGARVTRIWGADAGEALEIAQACSIEHVCQDPTEVCDDVGGVLVLSADAESHPRLAKLALDRRIPTYIDKPMAPDMQSAETLFVRAAERQTACFSGSALHFSQELRLGIQTARGRLGSITEAYAVCPTNFTYAGIHILEMIFLALGSDVLRVHASALPGRDIILLEYADGRSAVAETIDVLPTHSYHLALYGPLGHVGLDLHDFGLVFVNLLEAAMAAFRTNEPACQPTGTLQQMRVYHAARAALATRQPQPIS